MVNQFFSTFSSPFDTFTIIWEENDSVVRVQRVFLSDSEVNSETKTLEALKTIESGSAAIINSLGKKIQMFLKGDKISFDLDVIDLKRCFDVQKRVLLSENSIPRGWVSTYKRIANNVGIPKGARVIGNALARNPFPIIIPCHRAIKSNGELGGFQGGIKMKQILLEMEGIIFSNKGKVITNKIYY